MTGLTRGKGDAAGNVEALGMRTHSRIECRKPAGQGATLMDIRRTGSVPISAWVRGWVNSVD
jgi:hypothetical protein